MKYLVELPNGDFVRKEKAELLPTDLICFDGPDAFADTERLQTDLDAEIHAAGGLEAWRKAASGKQRMAA
jgi:hypothetical protein